MQHQVRLGSKLRQTIQRLETVLIQQHAFLAPKMCRIFLVLCTFFLGSCTTIYYNFWETFGQEKRDLLRSNIVKTQEAQDEVQNEFKDTLERVRSEYSFDGGSLEKTYDQLNADYEDAQQRVEHLSSRINKVEDIAGDLFAEWKEEAGQISNRSYQRDSLRKRRQAMKKFERMLTAMRRVEKTTDPVLTKLKDQVLYLKHNLNARALGSFKLEFQKIERELTALNSEIHRSTEVASEFIGTL